MPEPQASLPRRRPLGDAGDVADPAPPFAVLGPPTTMRLALTQAGEQLGATHRAARHRSLGRSPRATPALRMIPPLHPPGACVSQRSVPATSVGAGASPPRQTEGCPAPA